MLLKRDGAALAECNPPRLLLSQGCFGCSGAGDRVTCPVHGKGAWDELVFPEYHTQMGGWFPAWLNKSNPTAGPGDESLSCSTGCSWADDRMSLQTSADEKGRNTATC